MFIARKDINYMITYNSCWGNIISYELQATSYGLRVAALYFVGLTTGIPYIYDINYARSFIYAIYYLTIFMND